MVSSNFGTVRLSPDGSKVQVSGRSDLLADMSTLQVAVTAPIPADEALAGADLAPRDQQEVAKATTPLEGQWTAEVANTGGRFKPGDLVLLAGTAIHVTGDLGVETWIGCTTVLSHDAEKVA
jgi:nitrogen fixation protein FixH